MKFNKRAFTLVEILIASVVLAMLMTVVYKLYFGVSRSFQKGSWSLNAQNKLRNSLNYVREEMQKASFKTIVGLNGVVGTDTANPFKVANGEITNGKIATWYICLPFVSYDATSPGAVYQCELKLNGGKLIYTKALIDGSDPKGVEHAVNNYVIIRNVSKIEVSTENFDVDKMSAGKLIVLKAEVRHPDVINFPSTHVVAQTGAKVELTVTPL